MHFYYPIGKCDVTRTRKRWKIFNILEAGPVCPILAMEEEEQERGSKNDSSYGEYARNTDVIKIHKCYLKRFSMWYVLKIIRTINLCICAV
jgi:hypothetical protein